MPSIERQAVNVKLLKPFPSEWAPLLQRLRLGCPMKVGIKYLLSSLSRSIPQRRQVAPLLLFTLNEDKKKDVWFC